MKNVKQLLTGLFFILLIAAGCAVPAGSPGKTGKKQSTKKDFVDVSISLNSGTRNAAGTFDDVTGVTVDVYYNTTYYADDLAMSKTAGVWTVSITDLPAGINLVFEVHAYNAAGKEIFTGTKIQCLSSSNETINIDMVPFTELVQMPRILEIVRFSKVNLTKGAWVKALISANSGEEIEYEFNGQAGTGTFSPDSGSIVMPDTTETIQSDFTPQATGVYPYSVKVINSQGNSVTADYTMEIIEDASTGEVVLSFPPVVMAVHAHRTGSNVEWTAEVYDDGASSEITYLWEYNETTSAFDNPASNPAIMENYTETMQGTICLTVTDENGSGLSSCVTFNMEENQFPDEVRDPVISLTEYQAIPTNGATDFEVFTIGTDTYMTCANHHNDSTCNVDSKIYKWNGTGFDEFQSIATNGCHDFEVFTIGQDTFLAASNNNNGSTYNIDSKIYKWDGAEFTEIQAIPVNGAHGFKAFTIGSDTYLAAANYYNNTTHDINSKIYKWNGTEFALFQEIPTKGAADFEIIMIGNEMYLAAANQYSTSAASYNTDSKIYRWNGSSFEEYQSIPTTGAHDWEVFTIDSDIYLAIANFRDGNNYNIDSKIYKWNGTEFIEIQSIPTNYAYDWESFTIGTDNYLAVSNHYNGSTYNIKSRIYKWNGSVFTEVNAFDTNGACDWKAFTIDNKLYLAAASHYNGSSFDINSMIYVQDWE